MVKLLLNLKIAMQKSSGSAIKWKGSYIYQNNVQTVKQDRFVERISPFLKQYLYESSVDN